MPTSKAVNRTASAAFKRVKPLLDHLRDDIREASKLISKEYDALPKLEKAKFAERVQQQYGWSRDRLSTFARIGREFPKKAKIISSSSTTTKLDSLETGHMTEIIRTPDELLKAAAEKGMFDKPVSVKQIESMRKTGKVLVTKQKSEPKTDLQKIRAAMVDARQHIDKASLKIGEITGIMEDTHITDAKGKEATALILAFEKLCTKMATANPTTSKRAFAILRGEA